MNIVICWRGEFLGFVSLPYHVRENSARHLFSSLRLPLLLLSILFLKKKRSMRKVMAANKINNLYINWVSHKNLEILENYSVECIFVFML